MGTNVEALMSYGTIDREIFTLKIILMQNFRGVKFSWFHLICKIFLMVDAVVAIGTNA